MINLKGMGNNYIRKSSGWKIREKNLSTERLINLCNGLCRVMAPNHVQESFGQYSSISGLTVKLSCEQSAIEFDDPNGSPSPQDFLFCDPICNSKCYAFL